MNKTILIVALAMAPFAFASAASATPNNENTHYSATTTNKVKKKKVARKNKHIQAVKVEDSRNPFIEKDKNKCAFLDFKCLFGDGPIAQETVIVEKTSKPIRTTIIAQKTTKPVVTCRFSECKNSVYEEAKRWEGKAAMANRQELKTLLTEHNNQPVDPAHIPWCAAFANAILNRLGYEGTGSLMARSFLALNNKTKQPEIGDIVVLKRGRDPASGHVGFFEGFEEVDGVKYVKVFGGNTEKMVTTGWYPVKAVLGYRKIA
jgi:uncharacterized protein (TIGR02594 family)